MQMPEHHFSKYVFVVTGMSYIIDSSGTSKVVKRMRIFFARMVLDMLRFFQLVAHVEKAQTGIARLLDAMALLSMGNLWV